MAGTRRVAEPAEPAQAVGRRERHKRATYERLYTASIDLFTGQGYEETSIEEITERADVARGTFFNYFEKKEEVIAAWGARRRDTLRAELGAIAGGDSDVSTCLENCMRALAKINKMEWRTTQVMLTAWVRCGHPIFEAPYATSLFADIVASGKQAGEIADHVDPTLVGNILRDVYLGTLYRYVGRGKQPTTLANELVTTLRLVMNGVLVR
ncbi:TetR/AcrR family transcriptional regulator [Lentzea jiangxiensis]|uniref:DNA-binding transcriptional regulator, AcrR family n=1 Tax=Lentzea jiangxiensis TaxID=641025 RepID=A0A1H0WZH9_9PSEU|nr:TetR/AcrR family transcriptional regulator [Lentzea jiangxiensis]SDP95845.1 DNA-binding transcriptional regulator, AcrR family [Lentzea jiangxiensis]